MMTTIPMNEGLLLAAILFAIGLTGALIRRNLIFLLLSVEIMLNAAGLAFVVAGARWGQADGQVMFIFILAMASVEVAIGLAMIVRMYHIFGTIDSDAIDKMKG
ncbi:MAG TPA: NADH-quinone oxidoreductase subunit NuoK [Sunxiuqinia sp.]|nr:NADH-quinone oxidoreductase subunit NuoK [Sunxiuqinia sp.]